MIGSICEIVVSSVLSPRPTRLPGFTCVVPTSPSIGDVIARVARDRASPSPPPPSRPRPATACRVLRGARVVELLLADGLLRHERRVSRDVVVRLLEPRLGGRQFGLRLPRASPRAACDRSRRAGRPCERTTLAEVHRLEEAFDARADVDVLESLGLPDQVQVHRHVLLDDGRDVDLGRRRRDGARLLARRPERGRDGSGDHHRSSVEMHAHVVPHVLSSFLRGPRVSDHAAAVPSGPRDIPIASEATITGFNASGAGTQSGIRPADEQIGSDVHRGRVPRRHEAAASGCVALYLSVETPNCRSVGERSWRRTSGIWRLLRRRCSGRVARRVLTHTSSCNDFASGSDASLRSASLLGSAWRPLLEHRSANRSSSAR